MQTAASSVNQPKVGLYFANIFLKWVKGSSVVNLHVCTFTEWKYVRLRINDASFLNSII